MSDDEVMSIASKEGLTLLTSGAASSGYKYVERDRSWFQARYKRRYLGSHPTAAMAALAIARVLGPQDSVRHSTAQKRSRTDDDESDVSLTAVEQTLSSSRSCDNGDLSAYELQRLSNISRNEDVLRSLGLLKDSVLRAPASKRSRLKQTASQPSPTTRRLRSMNIQDTEVPVVYATALTEEEAADDSAALMVEVEVVTSA